uniref:Uncharacterized protein n=1 Tax=Glossina brevipalpis TaxID=37001 RepID=A0A1A9WFK3_9MUSC
MHYKDLYLNVISLQSVYTRTFETSVKNRLVWSNSCHIPSINLYDMYIVEKLETEELPTCSNRKPLVVKQYDTANEQYFLYINFSLTSSYGVTNDSFNCCYSQIIRVTEDKVRYLMCKNFQQNFVVPKNIKYMLIECRKSARNSLVYQDGLFFIFNHKNRTKYSRKDQKNTLRKFGILLFGIDSVSHFNARRTMPRVVKYMQTHNWYELSGYNKIGENTFPNLMAVLTGFNLTDVQNICKPRLPWGLNNCSTLFKTLRRQRFLTAFAEDECSINTFNYDKAGFRREPTDYYQRPLLLALEDRLMYKNHYGNRFCIGQKRYVEYIYDFGLEFAERFLGQTIFGLFWINSVSHNSWHGPLSIEQRMLDYLDELNAKHILEHNVVVFFSDHGSRWGHLRNRKGGFIEERLPMFFMWLPKWFQNYYPEAVIALKQNKHRLTSPYDFHATLKHLSVLAQGKNFSACHWPSPPQGCLTCQSFLKVIPEDRSCSHAGIEDYWCTCTPYYSIDTQSDRVRKISETLIHHINAFLKEKNVTNLCAQLTLKTVKAANIKMNINDNRIGKERTTYRITFIVNPNDAKFDGSYHLNHQTKRSEVNVETISRLNSYAKDSQCVKDAVVKKLCICLDNVRNTN